MGVTIKYVLEFPRAGFKVSNDLLAGDFIIDACVTTRMMRGPEGGTFEIKLYDLPEDKANELYEKAQSPKDARVVIKLGYRDGAFDTVMEGVYRDVTARVEGDKLVTTINGEESGTYVLKHTRFQKGFEGKIPFKDAVTKLLKEALADNGAGSQPLSVLATLEALLGRGPGNGNLVDQTPHVENVGEEVEDVSMKGESLMDILDALARNAHAEFLVCDKKVHIGKPITNDDYVPDEFDPDVNLAVFRPLAKNLPGEEGDNRLVKLPPHRALGFKFITTGDPRLRPGQQVFAKVRTTIKGKVEGYTKADGIEFRIHSLEHSLCMKEGYRCTGKAAKTCTDDNCRRQQDLLGWDNPDGFVQALLQRAKDERRRNPAIEVGTVKQYNPGDAGGAPHRSTLYFGQRFASTETQPSVRAQVEKNENQLLRNKSVVSAFAWHKCGLVVPVYPGMKALLSHNLSLPNDALVTGFLWSEKPALEPPRSKEGDWWLCLPIDFDPSNPPSDDTKAVNDLIAHNGKRVIEVKGLKITVGKGSLGGVGARPVEGADDEFVIEHKSGTKFKIASDGALTIEASSISLKGDVTIEGNVEIK
jgi:hypothetical protein